MADLEIDVVDAADEQRFEARTPDGVAGFTDYRVDGGTVVLTHSEVDDAYEGQGVGSTMVRGLLDQLRERGAEVRPECPFVRSWIDKHPDYADLVA